jgi:hypothetical protein
MADTDVVLDRTEIVEDRPIEQIITEDFIRRFEAAAQLYQSRYLPLCLKMTNEKDWVNHSGTDDPKFSLQASGAEKVCNPLGIVWDRPAVIKHERKDEKGDYYEYEIEGIVKCRVLQRYGWFTGNCDSRDRFFVARGSFSEGDIRKAALSNFIVNAVTRLAGIRNPTPEMLVKAGLRPELIPAIDYKSHKPAALPTGGPVRVQAITQKTGTGAKGAWTRYTVAFTDGRSGSTFDRTLAEKANEAKTQGAIVVPELAQEGNFMNLKALGIQEPAAPPKGNGNGEAQEGGAA